MCPKPQEYDMDAGRSSPLARHVATTIGNKIKSGEYRAGQHLPSERELAQEFNVSRLIIRHAIHELEAEALVSCSARCRPIVQTVSRTPILSTTRHTLGLWLWLDAGDREGTALLNGIQRELDYDEFRLVLGHASGDSWHDRVGSESTFLDRMTEDSDIAGIIIWCLGGTLSVPALNRARNAGISFVFVDRLPPVGFDADHVGVDNETSAFRVVEHLTQLGHRRIAHITNIEQVSTVADRHRGYVNALSAASIAYDEELVFRGSASRAESRAAMEEVLDEMMAMADPPTAVFVVNDGRALNLMDAARLRGLRVPEDLAIAGFDGTESWTGTTCTLTTANQPFDRIGAHAARLLKYRMGVGQSSSYRHVFLEAPFTVHGSTVRF
jgi:LacI family transcriptional regulator